ncbi:DUF2790 domain-containing protein [Pseudomonas sp. NA-150]|uniref:DUF2790 domain-containing protein n=1 Tax=Pseudomonas sp. NA-150 TaxID=3367525 RepID=UPI0037C60634
MFKFLLIGALSFAAFTAQADDSVKTEALTHYQYGMKLDIAQVVSQTESQDVNGITPVQLTYRDSQGVQHVLEYNTVSVGTSG